MSTGETRSRTVARAFAGSVVLIGGLLLLVALPARAADDATPAAASAASAAASTSAPLNENSDAAATLHVFNRPIVRFQVGIPGVSPVERARRAEEEVKRRLQSGGPGAVSTAQAGPNTIVLIDDIGVFLLAPGDLSERQTASEVVRALQQAVAESREARSLPDLLRAAGLAVAATLAFAGVAWLLRRLRHGLAVRLLALGERHSGWIAPGGVKLFSRERIFTLARTVTTLGFYALLLGAATEWLGIVLRLFPFTRRWGEELNESALTLAGEVFVAIASSLPGLAVVILIFFGARAVLGLTKPFFAQVERGDLDLPWIDRYTVRATRGLVQLGVWLFALAMAYPYLPGSQTDAFRGISVVLGLMLSLGSSNVIGQAISGLIITYSRTLRIGEYVRIGDVEGTVTETGTFATRIRTGLGEELTLPNSMIVGTVTKNYSRTVKGAGYVVDTVMTIGYDTPWRQVHAMMIEAAQRTEGILEAPAPHVFQTALNDFYVEYRLVAQAIASAPRPRAQVLADLHANLQDVFNENGVQIMSPHYFADPAQAKIVLPEHWNPPLAGKG